MIQVLQVRYVDPCGKKLEARIVLEEQNGVTRPVTDWEPITRDEVRSRQNGQLSVHWNPIIVDTIPFDPSLVNAEEYSRPMAIRRLG